MNKKFNVNQEKAVTWKNGPCLVLAGPGSGKTFVLTNRILNLIKNFEVTPSNILVITFTRASANEMKERFIRLLNEEKVNINELPIFGTFHSVFFEILRENFGYDSNSLIGTLDKKRYLIETIENNKKLNINNDLIDRIISDIDNYKTSLEKGEVFIPKSVSSNVFDKIFKLYNEKMFNNKKLDFHDMISVCKKQLLMHNDILKYYQNQYKYILIDEFQDINKEQYEIIKLLCKSKNLFVVGDDDQSIYKFRGSHPKVMSDFLYDYKNANKILLNENYRCARIIVKFSKLVIDNNEERFEKQLVSKRDDKGELVIKSFIDSKQENEYIISEIKKYINKGFNYSDIAILYRTNLLSRSICSDLKKHNINYVKKGEDRNPYDNFAIKDILSYLKLSINNKDYISLQNIANKPLRYISRESIKYKGDGLLDIIKHYKNIDFINKNILKLKNDLDKIKTYPTPLAIRYIRDQIKYDDFLIKYCKDKKIDYDEIIDILNTFEEEAVEHLDILEFIKYIENYKEPMENVDSNCLSLMTFHLSKGLEFKVVFIIDANDGLIPHKKSIKDNDIETERRLFYVGMTRAKDNLYICYTKNRFGKDFKISRFILEAIGGK